MAIKQLLENAVLEDGQKGLEDEEGGEESEEDSYSYSEEDRDDTVTLEKNCYSLVIVGVREHGTSGGSKALACVMGNSFCQMAVIYVVGCASTQYYFDSGAWLLPFSDSVSTNLMKAFASVLTVFQVTQEMQDVSAIFRTLAHSPRLDIALKHRLQCLVALVLQYVFALVVLVVAMQLVLSRQKPMDTLWITFYVFMTLNFDNNLCRFILFFFGLELNWKFVLEAPTRQTHRRWNRWYKRCGYILFLVIPMVITGGIFFLARACDICPLTLIRFGAVSNKLPVLMLSSNLDLPQGCCPVKVHWSPNRTSEGLIPVMTSVPCLSRKPPEDDSAGGPELYWVVWPDRKVAPNSLQIMEGRGGDGTPAQVSGKVTTRPSQMRLWLTQHDYDSDAVYHYLIDRKEGISLYRSKFTYVGEWNVTGIAWEDRNRIFVTARNPRTGALSPDPVHSEILLRELCAPYCWRCADNGACLHCERGYARQGNDCQPCAEHCHECQSAGAGGCDRGKCKEGFGIARDYISGLGFTRAMGLGTITDVCKPCMGGKNCTLCDRPKEPAASPGSGGGEDETQLQELPCQSCRAEFGVVNGTCQSCFIGHCEKCAGASACRRCEPGYTIVNRSFGMQECLSCAANCTKCDATGPGRCDTSECKAGFTGEFDERCLSCSPHCLFCNVSGAGGCNQGQCEEGYTQNAWRGSYAPCEACSAHCRACSSPGKCDWGGCEPGFGLQGDPQCARCAEDNCLRCDESWHKCDECIDGYGFSSTKTCKKCGSNCKSCSQVDKCTECEDGFRLSKKGACVACADQCRSCTESGEGFCDKGDCEDGWTTVSSTNSSEGGFTCRPCVDPACRRCDLQGPEHCDTAEELDKVEKTEKTAEVAEA